MASTQVIHGSKALLSSESINVIGRSDALLSLCRSGMLASVLLSSLLSVTK